MLGSLRDECCVPYPDDLMCYSRSFSDHVEVIRKVLQAMQHHGVKLRAEKCEMFQKEVRYVGRLVSAQGVQVDPKDLDAMLALKTKPPQTVGDLRQVLGFLSYYHSYVQDFAKIAKPLYELLQIKSSVPQPPPRHCKSRGPQLPSKTPIEWRADHQSTLERLVSMLTNPPSPRIPQLQGTIRSAHRCIGERAWRNPLSATGWENASDRIWITNSDTSGTELQTPQWKTRVPGSEMGSV